jgi:dipeptidyl-peptidase-4
MSSLESISDAQKTQPVTRMQHRLQQMVCRAACLAFLISSTPASGQPGRVDENGRVTSANFQLANRWSVDKQLRRTRFLWTSPRWLTGTNRFTYKHETKSEVKYYLVDAESASREELFDRKKLASLLRAETHHLLLNWKRLPVHDVRLVGGGQSVEFMAFSKTFSYDLRRQELTLRESPRRADSQRRRSVSPNGKLRVSVRGHNLFLARTDASHDSPVQITFDGEENYSVSPDVVWSPDSSKFLILRDDWRKVKDLWVIDALARPRPTLAVYKWPMPGEDIEQYSLWSYDTKTKRLTRIDADRWVDQTVLQPQWSHDSSRIYYVRMSRDWLSLDLCSADPVSGESSVVIEERDHRQLICRLPYHLLHSTGEVLWWSLRDGWGHYYLCGENGDIRSVTHGTYHAGKVVGIDEDGRVLYFMVNGREEGRNPYYHHLYRVSLDNSGLTLLTPEDAEHEISMSESCSYFLDNYSRADWEPSAVVRDNSGALVLELEKADITELLEAGWQKPDIFSAKAADGQTDLWGVMFKPYDLDPSRKYPVITYGYPGKETESLPWRFYDNGWVTRISVALAQYGFIVVVSGNRGGSPERSYAYYDFSEPNLRDYPIADKKAVLEQLAAKHGFIDLDRVGILGQSSGGFMAATAILLYPDFFKVAVAKSGNHDNSAYYHHWNERYGDVHETKDEKGRIRFRSETPSALQIAGNLEGRLVLITPASKC